MSSNQMRTRILQRLRDTEREHGVQVLYAVESGSRAWGFASPGSDYDVRFIYRQPRDWYLSVDVEDKRDVIEHEIADGLDLSGWDIRKALKLLWASNPTLVEWLQSPLVYVDVDRFGERMRQLCGNVYSVEKGIHHYHNMAKTNYQGYLKAQLVPLKKYFYVLRSLFAVRWLHTHGEPAPVEFERLRAQAEDQPAVNQAIEKLMASKKSGQQKEFMPSIPALNDFIETELAALAAMPTPAEPARADLAMVNELFRSLLQGEAVSSGQKGV